MSHFLAIAGACFIKAILLTWWEDRKQKKAASSAIIDASKELGQMKMAKRL